MVQLCHRALFRLTKLNIRYPDGSRNVIDVDGWVVGEDGIRGMEGVLIDPLGKILVGATVGGAVAGFGAGMQANSTNSYTNSFGITTQTVEDAGNFAAGNAASKVGETYLLYINERAQQLVPHVQVLSGREATAVFSQNVVIDGLLDSMNEPDLQFVSLD
jgi:hypothetical protein